MFRLAFRNIFRHAGRTLLTLTAIALGVAGIILTGGFVEDIFIQLREATIHSQLGHIQIYHSGYYEVGQRDPFKYLMESPGILLDRLKGTHDVNDVMTRLNFSGLANNRKADLPIIGEGIEANKENRLGTFLSIVEGRQLVDSDATGILLGKGVAKSLNLRPGNFLTLLVNTPEGALNSLEFEVVGIFQSFSKEFDDRAVRISLQAAQDLLATTGVHSVVVLLNDSVRTDAVLAEMKTYLPGMGYEAKAWYELADFYSKVVDLYKSQFGVLQLIILIMVLLSVANGVNMAIYERVGEIGTLMALGNRRSYVFRLIVSEYTLLGLIGAGLGVVVGIGAAWAISEIGIPMPPPPNSELGYSAYIRIVPEVIVIAALVGFAATSAAAVIPAIRASRLPVVDALRNNI
ncbi:ABC transporter permease [Methylococcus sp. EFPC2]|uniref:ABC transporter permease n=1 Tax=Methylococcus sp. EFPC2 TaxID=2812648 RepID=UPI001967298E|nr:ABC transporter permease [Methylococcus sp. EFPC2]QSA95691.1 ABC transporter permease [Methylococcus sp. EFPC2]